MNISDLRIQYETAVPGGLRKAEQQHAGYVMSVGEGTEKPYEFRGTPWTIVHLLRWRAKTNTLKVFQKNDDFVFIDANVLA
jgi:hypothetical protein